MTYTSSILIYFICVILLSFHDFLRQSQPLLNGYIEKNDNNLVYLRPLQGKTL